MSGYVTKQRKTLLSYLEAHPDEQLSAKRIASDLAAYGISLSAVYRNLAALESEQKLRRCSKNGSRELYYQYTDAHSCRECLHLSCKQCGRTFHMDNEDAEILVRRVAENKGFSIDRADTMLYGVCESCQSGKNKQA